LFISFILLKFFPAYPLATADVCTPRDTCTTGWNRWSSMCKAWCIMVKIWGKQKSV